MLKDTKELYLNKIEETFIVESLRARSRAKRILWAVVAAVFLLLLAASVLTYIQKQRADDNASQAQSELLQGYRNSSQEALNNNDGLGSLLFLAEAVTANKDPKTNSLLQSKAGRYFPSAFLSGVMDAGANIKALALSTDDKLLVVQYDSSTAVWNIQNRQKIFSVKGGADNKHLEISRKQALPAARPNHRVLGHCTEKIDLSFRFSRRVAQSVEPGLQHIPATCAGKPGSFARFQFQPIRMGAPGPGIGYL